MTEASLVKSVRMSPELWAFVAARAKARGVSPNAWMVACVEAARARLTNGKDPLAGATAAAPSSPIKSRLKGDWKAP